ncbi:MAG: hypothetical protein ACTSUT_07435 [Promethearchaeota archaeon]
MFNYSALKRFFSEIYKILKNTDKNIKQAWFEISDINFLKRFDKFELKEFLNNFEFVKIKKGNYINYIVIDKILFILDGIKYLELDIKNLSELVDYNGFEALIQEILLRNNYKAIKNFRFSDKSNFKSITSQKRYEIDVIGIYQSFPSFILIIDAKQWKRRDSFGAINKAANLQFRRVKALKKNPEAFSLLVQKLLGVNSKVKRYLPFKLIPAMVSLEDNSIKLNDNQVPLVSIYNFNAFLQELRKNLRHFKLIEINKINIQKQLF